MNNSKFARFLYLWQYILWGPRAHVWNTYPHTKPNTPSFNGSLAITVKPQLDKMFARPLSDLLFYVHSTRDYFNKSNFFQTYNDPKLSSTVPFLPTNLLFTENVIISTSLGWPTMVTSIPSFVKKMVTWFKTEMEDITRLFHKLTCPLRNEIRLKQWRRKRGGIEKKRKPRPILRSRPMSYRVNKDDEILTVCCNNSAAHFTC